MRQVRSFAELHGALKHRLVRLEGLAIEAASFDDREKRRAASYIAIELHNCWAMFARSSYVSVMCGTRTLTGGRAGPGVNVVCTSRAQAIQQAIAFVQTRPNSTKEPHWFDSTVYTRLANNFQFANLASVTNAFGYTTNFFTLAPTFRNYFAHKNEETAGKVERIRQHRFPTGPSCPGRLMVEVLQVTSPPLAREWIHDVRVIGTLLLS
jgi:hypothetical protein